MEKTKPAKTSGFAQMSLATMQSIVRMNGGHNELAAYIVLCGGVNGRHAGRYCTHGVKSVYTRSGMTIRAAQKAVHWLEEHDFIQKPSESDRQFLGNKPTRATTVRSVLSDGETLDLAVSRQFIDGIKGTQDSALKQMLMLIEGDGEITRSQAICDAILLFAALMKEQDFAECAGVDPETWHQKFEPIGEDEDGDGTNHVVPVPDANAVLVTVKESGGESSIWPFVYEVFDETPKKESRQQELGARFWHAANQLRKLRLIYRVLILWTGDPLDKTHRKKAEPIATHYIDDGWAREYDPHLQYEVHKATWRSGVRDRASDFPPDGDIPLNFVGSGRYRYMVKAASASKTTLVAQLRVRYWPANESNVQGREIEWNRTTKYSQALGKIGRAT